jgi:hypothetical protein
MGVLKKGIAATASASCRKYVVGHILLRGAIKPSVVTREISNNVDKAVASPCLPSFVTVTKQPLHAFGFATHQ